MIKFILVGLGGFFGAILRYLASGFVQNISKSISFPYGTLAVNILGCFLIGVLSRLGEVKIGMSAEMRLFLMIGFLGSFTTFSTFANETLNLLQDTRFSLALINLGFHIFGGLIGVLFGQFLATLIWR